MSLRRSFQSRKRKKAIARKKAIRSRPPIAVSVDSSERTTTTSAIAAMTRKPRAVGWSENQRRRFTRSRARHEGADRECRGDEARPGEPEQPLRAARGRVEPRRQHGAERERAVDVVEVVGGAAIVGEEQQPESHLRDEQRLSEREHVREETAGAA